MTELVKAPDCALLVIDYLKPLLNLPASSIVPRTRPSKFLRVVQIQSEGFTGKALYHGFLSVEAWAQSTPDAADLAADTIAYLHAAHDFYAECGGSGFLADPDSGQPRYLFTADIWARGAIL